MKKTIINGLIIFAVALLASQITQAQGTVYLSNLGQTSTGSSPVGSDSWLAESFATGTNVGGYFLNSIQLGMTNSSGNPSSLTVMLYSAIRNLEYFPGSSLGTLTGSLNPATGGIFTYAASNLTLSPSTDYFIVLTAGTTIANGAYEWSLASGNYSPSDGWRAPVGFAGADTFKSSNGLNWTPTTMNPQFAINATAVPEPSSSLLLLLGSGVFIYVRRAFHRYKGVGPEY